jgi:hypothetical protein
MRKSWLLCVLLGTLAWGQAAPATPPPTPAAQAPGAMQAARPAPPPDTSADVPDDAPVITVTGACSAPAKPAAKGDAATAKPAAKTPAADCKTVITKAQFESLAKAVAPNMNPQVKRQLSSVLPRIIGQSAEAKKRGIQNTPQYKETLKFAEMQILSQQLQRKIQDDAATVPQSDIDAYYSKNPEAFQQFNLDRLFIPRTKQADAASKEDHEKEENLTDEQKKAKQDEEKAKTEANEQQMTKLADDLRVRAAAGEDFVKLQKEAFDAAGMKIESPTVNLPKVRRTGLPPAHSAVFDLKAGDVSQVISDNGGHYIYKVISTDELPLDQVKDEIHNKLQNERQHDLMDKITNSYKVDVNEKYFGAASAGPGVPPQRMPHPHMAPSPTTPQAPPGGPVPAQPPSAAPQTPPPAAQPN